MRRAMDSTQTYNNLRNQHPAHHHLQQHHRHQQHQAHHQSSSCSGLTSLPPPPLLQGHVSRYQQHQSQADEEEDVQALMPATAVDWGAQSSEEYDEDRCFTAHNAIKRLEDLLKMGRMTLCGPVFRERLQSAFETTVEQTQDFTDSAYTSHEHREKMLLICDRTRLELNQLLTVAVSIEQEGSSTPTEDFENALSQTIKAAAELKHQLQITALDQADELFKLTEEIDILAKLKSGALAGDRNRLDEYAEQFSEHAERVQEVCRLLHHVSSNETLQMASKNRESCVCIYGAQLLNACQRLCVHPSSTVARDNLDVFLDLWLTLCSDIQQLSRDISELLMDRSSSCFQTSHSCPSSSISRGPGKHVTIREHDDLSPSSRSDVHYMSQRPSVSGLSGGMMSRPGSAMLPPLTRQMSSCPVTAKAAVDSCLDEQGQVIQPQGGLDPGLAMIPASSSSGVVQPDEGGEESSKCPDAEDNDIVRRAKAMSTLAFSMYQFTRGEGELKTTQDLFTQAESFAEEANKFYKVVRVFTYQVPSGALKKELLDHLAKVPAFVQQLQFSVKNSTVGKAATFSKVDTVIQDIKNLMNCVSKSVTSCLTCSSTYKVDMVSRTRSLSTGRYDSGEADYDGDSGMGSRGGSSSSDPNI